jgi:hypothetical protein
MPAATGGSRAELKEFKPDAIFIAGKMRTERKTQ